MTARPSDEASLWALMFPLGTCSWVVAFAVGAPWYLHTIPIASFLVGIVAMRRWW